MKTDLSYWKYVNRNISLMEAALLLSGIQPPKFLVPLEAEKWNYNKQQYDEIFPELIRMEEAYTSFRFYQDSLIKAIQKGDIKADVDCHSPVFGPTDDINPALTTINLQALAQWAIYNNEERDFLEEAIHSLKNLNETTSPNKSKKPPSKWNKFVREIFHNLKNTKSMNPSNLEIYQAIRQAKKNFSEKDPVIVNEFPLPKKLTKKSIIKFYYPSDDKIATIKGKTLMNFIASLKTKV